MRNMIGPLKILITLILALTILVVVVGCSSASRKIVAHPAFSAQYIRTNGYHSDVKYPVISVIKSKAELTAYYEKNKELYSLERRSGTIPSDSTIGFLDAVDPYDDAWFTKQMLILVLLEEGSGSNRHHVKDFEQGDQATSILIERQVPQVGTADMAEWHIIIALEKKDFRDQSITVRFS